MLNLIEQFGVVARHGHGQILVLDAGKPTRPKLPTTWCVACVPAFLYWRRYWLVSVSSCVHAGRLRNRRATDRSPSEGT